jgi:hypothetical protein
MQATVSPASLADLLKTQQALREVQTVATGQRTHQSLDTSPEALQHWLTQLRQHHPHARVYHHVMNRPGLGVRSSLDQ